MVSFGGGQKGNASYTLSQKWPNWCRSMMNWRLYPMSIALKVFFVMCVCVRVGMNSDSEDKICEGGVL